MPRLHWQKATHCGDASNCVNLAATPTRHILLRESDTPAIALTTTPLPLNSLIQTLKSQGLSSTTRPHS
ncbi:DUF397 domain-containing protein [Streptomyces phaeolivaceus]|uniref:DUF397 domain-containing protein n=1 Tax=Streptomyces phaeolivaceus TaxID=2653200 RepID=A0A5P8K447_9ACTN|nr:DUF397 domain-containing protein [Streptomyces phaeolivaceus]QFQ97824.1 DUF397 domain-containing protein [Streptomyces phaeolivaceus]